MRRHIPTIAAGMLLASTSLVSAETLTIATVNNGDMIRMQKLSEVFTAQHPDIELNWVILEENVLRQRVTTDIATRGGQYDILTIGTYETPIWGAQGWLVALDDLPVEYEVGDLLEPIANALSHDGTLYALPFYGESSFTMYRTDLFEKAGLEMPEAPSWDFVADAARKITDRDNEIYGICLRGKAGWGENMAFITTLAKSFGARWFDMEWRPQFDTPQWREALSFYLELMKDAGPPGASSNGFNENLALFQTGKCGMWIDATVAGSFVTNPKESQVHDRVGFALAPDRGLGKRANWLWAWALAIPSSSNKVDAAKTFITWATSKEYLNLVAEREGIANVPPGTRKSLYENQEYLAAAPFAELTLKSIMSADPLHPTVDPVPYVGVQYVAIPEFQAIGTAVGQQFSAAVAGQISLDEALANAQDITRREMIKAGYLKE